MQTDLARFLPAAPGRGNATEAVTDALREAILTGALAPGAWLREDEIARELGVSRTPVREAFRRIAEEQLVVKTTHQGTMVAGISYEDVRALYAVRIPLEGAVARFATEHRTDALVAELHRIQGEMETAAARRDADFFIVLNRQFHRALSDATGSLYLQRFMMQIENFVRRLPSTMGSPERQKAVLAEHAAIIKAIDAGDADAASEAATRHMTKVGEARLTRV